MVFGTGIGKCSVARILLKAADVVKQRGDAGDADAVPVERNGLPDIARMFTDAERMIFLERDIRVHFPVIGVKACRVAAEKVAERPEKRIGADLFIDAVHSVIIMNMTAPCKKF